MQAQFLTVAEAAKVLGRSTRAIQRAAKLGKIPAKRLLGDKTWSIPLAWIEQAIREEDAAVQQAQIVALKRGL